MTVAASVLPADLLYGRLLATAAPHALPGGERPRADGRWIAVLRRP